MKFSVKMWLMIILKVTEKQGSTLSLKNRFLEKPQEGGSGVGGGGAVKLSLLQLYFRIKGSKFQ